MTEQSTATITQWNGEDIVKMFWQASETGIDETIDAALANAQQNAPVLTGAYKAGLYAIKARRTDKGVVGGLGGKADHTIWVEIGTHRMPARWILTNAIRQEAYNLPRRIAEKVK